MTEEESRKQISIPKFGEPEKDWRQDRPNALTNTFGVVNDLGQSIPGVHVKFSVFHSPRLGNEKFVFSLMRVESHIQHRVYQQEINRRRGIKPGDHAYSHEHYGDDKSGRYPATADWANTDFRTAVNRFNNICSLTLTEELPDPEGFNLR